MATRRATIRIQDYEDPALLKKLDPVVAALQAEVPEAKYDNKSLARLLAEFLQFNEDAFGKEAFQRASTKLPAKLFQNYAPEGPLFVLAAKVHQLKQVRNISKIEFLKPDKRKENVEILGSVKRELVREGFLTYPVVYIHETCPDAARLKEIVKKLGGDVAAAPKGNVTHIVYPFGPNGDPDDGEEYLRTLELRPGSGKEPSKALVHYWYYPDSYDEWVPANTVSNQLEPDRVPIGPWKVYLRWLYDSEKYNEWMNPIDFETTEFQEEQEKLEAQRQAQGARGGSRSATPLEGEEEEGEVAGGRNPDDAQDMDEGEEQDNATNMGRPGPRKRLPEEGPERDLADDGSKRPRTSEHRPEVQEGAEQQVTVNATRQRVIQPHRHAMDGTASVENISQGQASVPPGTWPPAIPRAEPPPDLHLRPVPSPPAPVRRELHVVPAHSSWFNWNKIHDLERRGVPEFFNGRAPSKTPKVYKEYRDFMISKYREEPSRHLTFTEVRKHLAGDVNGIHKVFQFLERWGLINYLAGDKRKEQLIIEPQAAAPSSSQLGGAALAPVASSLFDFRPGSVPDAVAAATSGGSNVTLLTRKDHMGRSPLAPSTTKAQYFCNAMPWVDCTELRYHCTKFPDVDLCPDAYAEGRFPPGCTAKDFVRIDKRSATAVEPSGWSPQETLLLLEALELYGDNWAEIAEHVGTKTQLQCIMHILQLPIEDELLDELPSAPGVALGPQPGDRQSQPPQEEPIPFADTGNPIMAQVAFLAMMVGPKVGAAAAQRALEVLSEDDPEAARELAEAHRGTGTAGAPLDVDAAVASTPGGATGVSLDAPISSARMKAAAAAALGAAAVKAKLLAEVEEREIVRWVSSIIDQQTRKLDIKLKYLEELDEVLETERSNLEAARRQVEVERLQLQEMRHRPPQQTAMPGIMLVPQEVPQPMMQPGAGLSGLQGVFMQPQQHHHLQQQQMMQQQQQQQQQQQMQQQHQHQLILQQAMLARQEASQGAYMQQHQQ